MDDADLRRLEGLNLTYDGWGVAIHDWAPDLIKRAVAELRAARTPSVEPPRELIERANDVAADFIMQNANTDDIILRMAAEFTSVRSQAIAEAASLVPKLTREGFGQGVYNEALCDYAASIRSLR